MKQAARDQIALRLHAAAIHLLRRVRIEDAKSGLTPARASLLSILVFGGPHTIGQLAEAEQVAIPTVTKLVNGLERDGFVDRVADSADKRIRVVSATAKARRTLERARERRVRHLASMLADLPDSAWSRIDEATALIEKALRRPT